METNIADLTKIYGSLLETVGPSGKTFVIREQNGEDDELLSAAIMGGKHEKINQFLISIVVRTNVFDDNGGTLNNENIGKLLVNDKYFILFQSRIFSIGAEMKFSYDWGEKGGRVDYKDILTNYMWDFGNDKPLPIEGEEGYFEFRMKPYDKEHVYKPVLMTTSSGKDIRLNLTDVNAESYLLKKGQDATRNDDLKSRQIEVKIDGKFMKVDNFKTFTKRDMIEIHEYVSSLEHPFFAFTEIINPVTEQMVLYPMIVDPAFFFPLGI